MATDVSGKVLTGKCSQDIFSLRPSLLLLLLPFLLPSSSSSPLLLPPPSSVSSSSSSPPPSPSPIPFPPPPPHPPPSSPVLGPVDPCDVGVTLTHEHLLMTYNAALAKPGYVPDCLSNLKLTMENLGKIRHYP